MRTSYLRHNILGECLRRPERFVIRLSDRLEWESAVETLLHEWGHALAWNYTLDRMAREGKTSPEEFQAAAHDEAWGCAYSRVWREYLTLTV